VTLRRRAIATATRPATRRASVRGSGVDVAGKLAVQNPVVGKPAKGLPLFSALKVSATWPETGLSMVIDRKVVVVLMSSSAKC
jgi:hypothetical protein